MAEKLVESIEADGAGRHRQLVRRFGPVALAVLPLVVAAIRAALGPWFPINDNAYFTARSLDVGTEHHPLLGAWSSGSRSIEESVNNLGPLQLDLLAPFTRVAPWGGTAVGVAAVHAAAVATIGWMVARFLGVRYVLPAMVGTSLLTMTLGSELLITPQQHQYLVVPYLVVLVATWALTTGDRWSLVPFVFFASLVVQTHLSYPILVTALALPALAGLVASHRRRRTTPEHVDSNDGSNKAYIASGVLALVLWIQPLVDQFSSSGNLGAVLGSGGAGKSPSFDTSVRLVADVLVSAGGYVRPGYRTFVPQGSTGTDLQLAGLTLLLVGLVVTAIVSLRRGRRVIAAGVAVAGVACVAAVIDTMSLPIPAGFGLQPANYRWLWSTAALLVIGALCAFQRWVPSRWSRSADIGWLVLLIAVVSVNIPRSIQDPSPERYALIMQSSDEFVEQMESASVTGPVLIAERIDFANPYIYLTLTALARKGVDYRFEDRNQIFRFGDGRRPDGTEPRRLVHYLGGEADRHRNDPGLLAYVDGTFAGAVVLEENDTSTADEN